MILSADASSCAEISIQPAACCLSLFVTGPQLAADAMQIHSVSVPASSSKRGSRNQLTERPLKSPKTKPTRIERFMSI